MEEMEFKRGPGRPPKPQAPQTLPIKVLKAYWPLDGRGKCEVGDEIDLPADEARGIVEKGLAVRNDAF
jgi:hypothetical protein